MSEQQEHPEGAIAAQEPAQPAVEPQAPAAPPADAAQEPQPVEASAPVEEPAAEAPAAAEEAPSPDPPVEAETPPAAEPEVRERTTPVAPDTVGPKILGVAEEKKLPVVKKRLQEKPKREPLPWPELRAAVAATRDQLEIAELKELFRTFPEKLRDEVTESVRGFQKGARRPVSQHAAKQLARAAHTARRMKKSSHPSGEVAQALGQAMAAEMIASLEPEKAAQVILPKRDLLERESRQAQRRARDEEDKRRDEQRRARREDAKSSRQQTSFGEFSGAKIKGLDELAALFGSDEAPAEEVAPESAAPDTAAPETVGDAAIPAAEPNSPVTPATTTPDPEAQVEGEIVPEEATETGSAPQPDDGDDAAA